MYQNIMLSRLYILNNNNLKQQTITNHFLRSKNQGQLGQLWFVQAQGHMVILDCLDSWDMEEINSIKMKLPFGAFYKNVSAKEKYVKTLI